MIIDPLQFTKSSVQEWQWRNHATMIAHNILLIQANIAMHRTSTMMSPTFFLAPFSMSMNWLFNDNPTVYPTWDHYAVPTPGIDYSDAVPVHSPVHVDVVPVHHFPVLLGVVPVNHFLALVHHFPDHINCGPGPLPCSYLVLLYPSLPWYLFPGPLPRQLHW